MASSKFSDNMIVCKEMCFYCFDYLAHRLQGSELKVTPNFPDEKYPLFVTLYKGKSKKLRGCIGTFEPLPLHKGLKEYVIQSSFNDHRFDELKLEELKSLSIEVSLLTNFEKAKDYLDWTVGLHGIKIKFPLNGRLSSATFLPHVMVEHGWDKIETMNHLLRKGGFQGEISEDVYRSIQLDRYQSEKIGCSYDEYLNYIG